MFDVVYLKEPKNGTSTNRAYLPNDRRNTVYRTIEIMKEAYDIDDNLKYISLKISRLNRAWGGSSNAATVINI